MSGLDVVWYSVAIMVMMPAQAKEPAQGEYVDGLLRESAACMPVMESHIFEKGRLRASDVPRVLAMIKDHPDYRSYLVLVALRRDSPKDYKMVAANDRASVLCSAMAKLTYLNDFGSLSPEEGSDGAVGGALVELGKPALKKLRPLLDDKEKAPLCGSEDATESVQYGYRRADYAFRYVNLILEGKTKFDRDVRKRDAAIEGLKKSLGW
jgi:hypothetical protein